MSTFSPKRPDSRAKERYSPSGPNVTYSRRAAPSEVPGTAVYGIQEIPVKKPQKANFEKSKTVANIKASKVRPTIDTSVRKKMESNRSNPIACDPLIPSAAKKDTPTFRSSADNPLSRNQGSTTANGNSIRYSSRYAARLKFEAAHSKSPASDENKNAGQWEACRDVKESKRKEKTILRDHPHGLGFGSSSCQS